MIIIFNFIGAGILIAAIGVGYLVTAACGPKAQAPAIIMEGLVLVALDLLYRLKREDSSLFHPRRGGHISFIPVWILGFGFLVFGGYGVVSGDWCHESSASNESAEISQPNNPQRATEPPSLPRANMPTIYSRASQPKPPPQPAPVYPTVTPQPPKSLKLGMISGTGPDKLATINGETFAVGETHSLKLAQKTVTLTCLEIRDQSVVAKVAGESLPMELRFGKTTP